MISGRPRFNRTYDHQKVELAACPACGNKSLIVGPSTTNRIVCNYPTCPDSRAVEKLLEPNSALSAREHIVTIEDHHWSAKHPLYERVDDALLGCDINVVADYCYARGGGTYRVTDIDPSLPAYDKARWAIERI